MCGISAATGIASVSACVGGIEQIQNRGYDATGYACALRNKCIRTTRAVSTDGVPAFGKLKAMMLLQSSMESDAPSCIAHTRWATHGTNTIENAHPHQSFDKRFSVVHNGIVCNHLDLRQKLSVGAMASNTDTEVISHLLAQMWSDRRSTNVDSDEDTVHALESLLAEVAEMVEGSFALAVLCADAPDRVFCIRRNMPLLVAVNESSGTSMASSEVYGLCISRTSSCYPIIENRVCVLGPGARVNRCAIDVECVIPVPIIDDQALDPSPFHHFTMKEIAEQPIAARRAMIDRISGNRVCLEKEIGSMISYPGFLNHIVLIGSGSSYNASMTTLGMFKDIRRCETVHLFDAYSFDVERDFPRTGRVLVVAVSQSGETKDLVACVDKIKASVDPQRRTVLAVVNVENSYLARKADLRLPVRSGREIGVAATKSFVNQCLTLSALAMWLQGDNANICEIEDMLKLPDQIQQVIASEDRELTQDMNRHQSMFIVSDGYEGEGVAREIALKLKEIAYVHAEGCNWGALKHGPFALLCKDLRVVAIQTKKNSDKLSIFIDEVVCRNSPITVVGSGVDRDVHTLRVPYNNTFSSILSLVALQLAAYRIACSKGINCDRPRNLAKTCTVE